MDLSTQAAFALLSLCVLGEDATSLWAVAFSFVKCGWGGAPNHRRKRKLFPKLTVEMREQLSDPPEGSRVWGIRGRHGKSRLAGKSSKVCLQSNVTSYDGDNPYYRGVISTSKMGGGAFLFFPLSVLSCGVRD